MDDAEERANNVIDLVLKGLVSEGLEKKQIALEKILFEFLEENRDKFERLHETVQWETPHQIEERLTEGGDEEQGE